MVGGITTGASRPVKPAIAGHAHLSGLDSVRAFAALSVLLAHILGPRLPAKLLALGVSPEISELSKYIFTGHPAVIVFFVVSGFCIHYPYTQRELPVVAFTLARWTRIMPPALVAMGVAWMLNVPKYNFVDGYILWSIVCELWYYSLYPFLLLLARKVSFEAQFAIAFATSLILVSFLGTNEYGSAHIYGPWLNWLVALPSWLLGCVLAEKIRGEGVGSVSNRGLWRILVATLASVLYWLTLNTFLGYYLTMNFFSILVFFWMRAEICHSKGGNLFFEWMGKWSYSMYLLHMVFLGALPFPVEISLA